MAWAEILEEDVFSVGIGAQTDINTPAVSYTWIDCEMPQVSHDAAQNDTKRSRRARGAATPRLSGRVWPRIAIKFPVPGQPVAYAFASDTPAFLGANLLLAGALGGSTALAYQLGGVSPTDGNTVSLITSQGKLGALMAAVESGGGVAAMGFIKSIGSGGPYATNLREDLKAQPGTTVRRAPTLTVYPGATALLARTIRVTGEHTNMQRLYYGCVLTKATFAFDADWRLHCTAELIAYGGEPSVRATAAGGLQTITEMLALDPLVLRGGARYVLGSNVFTAYNDGTADATGTCDIRDLELVWDIPHYVVPCPDGIEGVGSVVAKSPRVAATFSVPDISDFQNASAEHFAEAAWRDRTSIALSCYLGDTPGQLLAWNIPAGLVANFPETVNVDGVRHRRVTLEAGYYAGDEAATEGGNKIHNFAIG